MATLYNTLLHYLLDHPTIRHYEWRRGQTPGSTPLFLFITVATYLTATLSLYRHPQTLPATALRVISAAHNLLLALLSLLMAVATSLSLLPHSPSFSICFPVNTPPQGPTFFWAHFFYFSKILEFVDTLLILLGGAGSRARRLSFLHVYHHAVVVVMCYLWLDTVQSLFPIALVTNAMVHVIMYTYYFLTGLGIRPRWKRLVTDCQIVQFVFSFVISGVMLYYHFARGGCSGIWGWCFNAVFNASLLALFVDFHLKNYARKKKKGGYKVDKQS